MNLGGEIRFLEYCGDSVQTMVNHLMAQLQYRYILRL
jgi:hypothetical protein